MFQKYKRIIVLGTVEQKLSEDNAANLSLLDLESVDLQPSMDLVAAKFSSTSSETSIIKRSSQSDIDVLCDVFNSANIPEPVLPSNDLLLPLSASNKDSRGKQELRYP